ncbi:MAG: hypothetical protein ACYS1A_19495 [Planctomycetota bacterium]|jgi:hypothetical protein
MRQSHSIQTFIKGLDEKSIPKVMLIRVKKGFTNGQILDAYRAMMIDVDIKWDGTHTLFVVPLCNLALRIGLGHGLSVWKAVYPEAGYFADPKNTIDETYKQIEHRR